MKYSIKVVLFVFALSFIFSDFCFAQTIGKIFTKEEANTLFGRVVDSVKISPAELNAAITKTEKDVMFRLVNGTLTILGDRRAPVYPSAETLVGRLDVFHRYSKSLVVELLSKGTGDAVYMENRKDVFSVTFGGYTLEMSYPCPPSCWED